MNPTFSNMDPELMESIIVNFNVNTNIEDVSFHSCSCESYEFRNMEHFGEKKCLLYKIDFTVFNVNISLRILSFVYKAHSEILKLEIKVKNKFLAQEMSSCINFLQRKRNLNLTFNILIKLSELFESRRLICRTIFQRLQQTTIVTHDTGMNIKFFSPCFRSLYLDVLWKFLWNIDNYEVGDSIEFYCNNRALETRNVHEIRQILRQLVMYSMSFQNKLKLWRSLLAVMYDEHPTGQTIQTEIIDLTQNARTLDLEDSDSSDNDDSVILTTHYSLKENTQREDVLVIE